MNNALAAAGPGHRESPFLLIGWPVIGAKKRMKRGTQALNNAGAVRDQAAGMLAQQSAPHAANAGDTVRDGLISAITLLTIEPG